MQGDSPRRFRLVDALVFIAVIALGLFLIRTGVSMRVAVFTVTPWNEPRRADLRTNERLSLALRGRRRLHPRRAVAGGVVSRAPPSATPHAGKRLRDRASPPASWPWLPPFCRCRGIRSGSCIVGNGMNIRLCTGTRSIARSKCGSPGRAPWLWEPGSSSFSRAAGVPGRPGPTAPDAFLPCTSWCFASGTRPWRNTENSIFRTGDAKSASERRKHSGQDLVACRCRRGLEPVPDRTRVRDRWGDLLAATLPRLIKRTVSVHVRGCDPRVRLRPARRSNGIGTSIAGMFS